MTGLRLFSFRGLVLASFSRPKLVNWRLSPNSEPMRDIATNFGNQGQFSAIPILIITIALSSGLVSGLAQSTTNIERYIIVLESDPAAAVFLKSKTMQSGSARQAATANAAAAAKTRAAEIKAQHDAFSAQLKTLGAIETGRYHSLLNAISIKATASQVQAIRNLAGVKGVHPSQLYEVNTASSVPFIGAPNVWGGISAADGAGA